MKKIIKTLLILFGITFAFLFPLAESAFKTFTLNKTENDISTIGDEATINVNIRKKSNERSVTTEYYLPKNISVKHSISATNENGEKITNKFNFLNSYKEMLDEREARVYYDVNNEVYTEISRHKEKAGTEQIKSLNFYFEYSDMTIQTDNSTWANAWDGTLNLDGEDKLWFTYYLDDYLSFTFGGNKKVKDNQVVRDQFLINTEATETDNQIITYNTYCRVIATDVEDRKLANDGGFLRPSYHGNFYSPMYQIRVEKVIQTFGSYSDENNISQFKIKKGTRLGKIETTLDGYQFCGFFSDENYNIPFDFSTTISEDTEIYLLYCELSNNNLTNSINNLQENTTLNIFNSNNGGYNGNYDVFSDNSYVQNTNDIFINEATISNGSTVNLTFNDNRIYEGNPDEDLDSGVFASSRTNSDQYISEEYVNSGFIGEENCSEEVKLNGNLTIRGTLNIGAQIGSYSNFSKYSYIIGKYAKIDLMGFNIIVDGGTLNCYGVIEDSVGGGCIIVKNGGYLRGTVSIVDGRQVRQEIVGLSKRQSPFTQYFYPYLRVPTYIYNGSSFVAYVKFDLGEFGMDNVNLSLFASDNALFNWSPSNDDSNYILYEPYVIDEIPESQTNLLRQKYNIRNKFVFNCDLVETSELLLSLTATFGISIPIDFDFLRLDVPVSSFFDFVLINDSTLTLKSTLYFYPGSSLYVGKNATLALSFKSNEATVYDEIGYTLAGVGLSVPGETRYICGGIVNYTNRISDLAINGAPRNRFSIGLYNTTAYWNYIKINNINIEGNITFDDRINTDVSTNDGFYILSGQLNISDKGLASILNNRNLLKTYSFKAELDGGVLLADENISIDIQAELATSYNCNCLISNDTAFIIDKDFYLFGKFSPDNGLFFTEGEVTTDSENLKYTSFDLGDRSTYFLETDTDMYLNGSAGVNQYDTIDRDLRVTKVNRYNINTKIINVDTKYYVYYCGIYIPVNSDLSTNEKLEFASGETISVNAQKFCSNYESSIPNANQYKSMEIKYNSSNKIWSFSKFI